MTDAGKHFTAADRDQLGFFEKANEEIPDYRKACEDGKRGFLGELYNAHHILPATSFKKSMKDLSVQKQEYIRNCQHITPWNINNGDNLIGLPHLRAFVLLWGAQTEAEGEAAKIAGQRDKIEKSGLERRRAALRRGSPENYPVHLPVSWGHTLYNHAVKKDIGTQIWQTLDEKKPSHDVDAQKIADALKILERKYSNHLKNRGVGATLSTWRIRSSDPNWYKSFTMFAGVKPLGDPPKKK